MMADHRKLKAYKKKTKEIKRPKSNGAEQSLQKTGYDDTSQEIKSDRALSNEPPIGPFQPSTSGVKSRSNVVASGGVEQSSGIMGRKSHRGDKDTGKKTGPTKERWLLTRKTWKYMQQAGRRLIPDGAQNRADDLPRIEEYFQHVCRTEQKFILWSRKSSYPGAIAASRKLKRRIRPSIRHRSGNKASSADEADIDEFKENDRRAAVVIGLLHSYLNIAEQDKRQSQQEQDKRQSQQEQDKRQSQQDLISLSEQFARKSLSGEQQSSSSAEQQASSSRTTYTSVALSSSSSSYVHQGSSTPHQSGAASSDLSARTAELLESLRSYSQTSHRPIIPPEHITRDLLHNKTLLKKIYNDLKRQQLSLVLNRHTAASTNNLSHASSLTSLFSFRRDQSKTSPTSTLNTKLRPTEECSSLTLDGSKNYPSGDINLHLPKDKYIRPNNQLVPFISVVKPAKTYTTQGMQTDFLQLHEIGNLRKEYEAHKKELDQMNQLTEDDTEYTPKSYSRRKSSVDNEDVSQSVSDTIKRYLRMARKKSVNDDAANRFKRVNYDRNLRNIRAKGEINPPGMDEGNSKATQTLDAWPLLHYNHIRGIDCETLLEEAHADWSSALQRRKQNQEEYLQQQKDAAAKGGSTTSGPSSPTQTNQQSQGGASAAGGGGGGGLFHSGTQFFSNLWHGYHHSAHDNSNNSTTSTTVNVTSSCNTSTTTSNTTTNSLYNNATPNIPSSVLFNQHHNQTAAPQQQQNTLPQQKHSQQQHLPTSAAGNSGGGGGGSGNQSPSSNMQKSKSSSNVGQFVSKKIWKSRSKSQSRISASNKPQWAPQGNCIWMSPSGKRVILTDARLRDLSEIERKILHRVAVEKINQLNIGVNVQPPGDVAATSTKSQKRRPLLIKRKALTTSIFDTGKKDDSKVNGGGLVFGVTIEKCVDNDRLQKSGIGNAAGGGSERGSRNSIVSLLGGVSHGKGSDHIGSCESLPSRSSNILGQYDDGGGNNGRSDGGGFMNLAAMKISRSQTDIRRGSQDEDELLASAHDAPGMVNTSQNSAQVPALVLECIKHIEEHGLNTVGIFRVSTSKKRVRQLKEGFDRGEITTLDADICPHDVATILKEYLRDLPEPLLCKNLYKAFVKTQKIRNRRLQLEALSHLIQLLPVAHRDTLYVLLRFLARIVRSSDDVTTDETVITGNKMDSNNLATVIAPNILRSSESGRTTEQEIDEQIDVINVIRTMIDHYEELFRVPAELMDEIYTNMMDTYPEQLDYLCERRDVTERYDDDMESGSSSTPMSSPPPIGVIKQQTTPFTTYTFATDDGGLSSTIDRNLAESRPIYSRDDFLHENTVKGGDPNGNMTPQRRERTSRMKYIESEHELTRRRRRERNLDDSDAAGTPSPTKTTFNSSSNNWIPFGSSEQRNSSIDAGQPSQYQQQQQAGQSRRLFPPYGDQGSAAIVTASLKIPVQMQQQQQQSQIQSYQRQRNAGDTGSGHIDLSDIPYIEDNGCGQDVLTGSLQVGRGTSTTLKTGSMAFQIPITIEGRTTSSSSDQSRSSTIHQYPTDDTSATTSAASSRRSSDNVINPSPQRSPTASLSSMPQEASVQQKRPDTLKKAPARKASNNIPGNNTSTSGETITSPSRVLSPSALLSQFGALQSTHSANPEPKLTPSISNIGGAVLRSKTADFERISKSTKKTKTTDGIGSEDFSAGASYSGPGSQGSNGSTVDDATKADRPPVRRQQGSTGSAGPIYKRQELISSAQRSSK